MTDRPPTRRSRDRRAGTASPGPGPSSTRRPGPATRVKQVALVVVATVLAGIMIMLGLWQMSVFESQKANANQARVDQPVVVWAPSSSHRTGTAGDYGRRVRVSGTYLPSTQMEVGTSWPLRVVTGLRTPAGEVLPVIRGQVERGHTPAPPPTGSVEVTGVLLASEAAPDEAPSPGVPSSAPAGVRLEVLAQQWPGPLIPATLTLTESSAEAKGLTPAAPKLPEGDGGARNRGYAMQWWAFAAFTLGMSIVFARALGRRR